MNLTPIVVVWAALGVATLGVALYRAGDLKPDERRAAELLLGQHLDEGDLVSVRATKGRVVKPGPSPAEREAAFARLLASMEQTAARVAGVPDDVVDSAMEEALEFVRHNPE